MNNQLSIVTWLILTMIGAVAQEAPKTSAAASSAFLSTLVAAGVPKPGPTNDAPYAPQPILQGGVVLSPYYPGPTPFARNASPPIPRNTPPAFITCAGSGDRVHARWADEYCAAMLQAGIPNIEIHIYGNGRHPGDLLSDGSRMSAGLADRNGTPFGTWQDRFIDWFRDLGFLQKPGVETRAARDLRSANSNH